MKIGLPKLPPNPADKWIKVIENEFAVLELDPDFENEKERFEHFDVSLGQHIDDVVETKDDQIIITVLPKTLTMLKELMDKVTTYPDPSDNDSWLLEEIIEKWTIIVSDHLDKWGQERKDAFIAQLKKQWTLDVKNWDPTETELENFYEELYYPKRQLSEETLKKVMDFLKRQVFDEEFEILQPHKFGGCRIQKEETAKQIFDRIEKNLMNIPQPLPDSILKVLVLTIIGILQGKKRISKQVLRYAKVSRQNLLEKYYDKYNKKKKHGYLFMLQACMRYLTRRFSDKQGSMLLDRYGIDSHWRSKFRWDYFTAYQKMEGVQQPNWLNDFGEAEWYSSPEKLNEEMNEVLEELTYCIKKGYIKFNFVYFVTLKDNIRGMLEERLNEEWQKTGKIKSQKKENSFLGIFLKEKFDAYYKYLIEYHNTPFQKEKLRNALREISEKEDDPYQEIAHLLKWEKNEYFMVRNEDIKLEYKANFFYTSETLGNKWEEEKERQRKKAEKHKEEEKERPIEKQKDFVKRIEKDLEIERWQEICAFLNTDGGRLFIGVDDNIQNPIFGIERDWAQSIFAKMSRVEFQDQYPIHIRDKIYSEFEDHKDYIDVKSIRLPKKEERFILMINVGVDPTRTAQVTLRDGTKVYVVRDGSQSKKMRNTNEYMKWRDKKMKSSE